MRDAVKGNGILWEEMLFSSFESVPPKVESSHGGDIRL